MDRRDISRVLVGVAGSALLPQQAQAQTCIAPCYPPTAAENAASFQPNTNYPPGNLLRYGADPTGVGSSDSALAKAIQFATTVPPSGQRPSAPARIYAPAGLYTFSTGVSTASSSFTLVGDGRGNAPPPNPYGPGGGTIFQLSTPAGNPNAAILTFTAFVEWIRIESIKFLLQGTQGQYCLNFSAGVAESLFDDCYFVGNTNTANGNTGCVGIAMVAPTVAQNPAHPYNGDVDIRHCHFANHYCGIAMVNANTTVRVTNCEFSGSTPAGSSTYGIDMSPQCAGVLIQGCSFGGWGIGILCQGAHLRQIANYFDPNVQSDFTWINGGQSGNAINNCSIGDVSLNSNGPTYSYPSGQGCVVVGADYRQH